MSESLTLLDLAATRRCGERLGRVIRESPQLGARIGLSGDLGTGKTTLAAAALAACGINGPVRSPTYTLLEPYEVATSPARYVYHLDLYRLRSPLELEDLGVRELLSGSSVLLVEWIENAPDLARRCDLHLHLGYAEPGRTLRIQSHGEVGQRLAAALSQQ